MLPFIRRWCRRYAAHSTAVGAVFHTAAKVYAAPFSADWCRRDAAHLLCCYLARTLPFMLLLDGDQALLSCCLWAKDVTTTYSMGTAAMTLLAVPLLLWK